MTASKCARVVELADSLDSGSSAHYGRAGSSPASRTNRKAFICKAFRFFLCTSDGCFHLFFPLQAGNAFDKPFHAVCAGLLHPICHMTIYIQCKCCGVVA